MHTDFTGYILESKGFKEPRTSGKKLPLKLNNTSGSLEQGIVPLGQTVDKVTGFPGMIGYKSPGILVAAGFITEFLKFRIHPENGQHLIVQNQDMLPL